MISPHPKYPIVLSILAAIATLGLKSAAYWYTDSVSLLSDAAESVVNLVASLIAFFSLWYAAQPVDVSHTYGHEKIEYFSSGIEGMLILVAAVMIAWFAVLRLMTPQPLISLEDGIAISGAATLINFVVALVLLRVGRREQSIVLEADGQHLMTDVWTSIAVIGGVGLVWLTGMQILDPLVAIVVAVNICWTGFNLIRRSFNG